MTGAFATRGFRMQSLAQQSRARAGGTSNEVNGLPQPSHPRRAQNQGAYPAPLTVARVAATDLYGHALSRARARGGGTRAFAAGRWRACPRTLRRRRGEGQPSRAHSARRIAT
jgi:hypothetical protein